MKHTKKILKSLLITVMALSLLAVSCKKDEGGSKPTAPTVTINATDLDEAIKSVDAQLAADKTLSGKVAFDFSSFTSADGKGNASAKVTSEVAGTALKTALETAFKLDTDYCSFTADAGTIKDADKTATLTITITLKGNSTFASDVTPKYSEVEKGKSVKTVITITPEENKGWDNK